VMLMIALTIWSTPSLSVSLTSTYRESTGFPDHPIKKVLNLSRDGILRADE
jgi:hypothetical protein